MSWTEDSVVFRGAIRRSGNSLVITIPAELSQRFLLREGQEFIIYGLGRKRPEFEGALQVYLGYFVVHEKAPSALFRIRVPEGGGQRLQELLRRMRDEFLPSRVIYRGGDGEAEAEFIFGAITESGVRRPRSVKEVEDAASAIEFNLRSEGFEVLERKLSHRIIEWRSIDPASISKAPYKLTEVVRWTWEI